MNAICEQGDCLHLLDLHNVWCNAVNHHHDPCAAIDRMRLDRVGEIHIAGGAWQDGFWMDAHNSRVPEEVWKLLEYTLPRAPRVGGVVFEVLEEHVSRLGPELIVGELARAREIWNSCRRDPSCH